ncbi:MAG: PAS domain-containing sensor histidine kinase, partial [Mucilaginibacter sp.]
DAIISKTLDGVITSWNKAAEKLFGYNEQQILGKNITILIPQQRQAEEHLIIGKVSNNEKVDHFETIRVTKTGKEIPVSLTVSPIRNTKGRIIGASKIVRNISRQKDAEMQLQQYAENLEDLYEKIKVLNAKKDEFIGLASHELKTPITSISGYLQIIEQSFINDSRSKGFIAKARSQVKKLSNLISDLLDVSKIQTGSLPLSYSSFDIVLLLKDVIGMMQQINPFHQISLYSDNDNLTIEADQQRIEQVIINLISNAVKYSPNSDRIIVRVLSSGEKVKVSIQDFGIGIERDQQERIFSRFYRVEHLAAHMSGLGIGLYISNEIIKRHHGELLVDSNLGKGSTFSFEIPAIRDIVA